MSNPNFDNAEMQAAWAIIEQTGMSLFLTGKAGTGKTTFLKKLRGISQKRVVVTAPTGIAAINAEGVTLHSLFQLSFSPFIPGMAISDNRRQLRFSRDKLRIIRSMDVLVIDEVSMVRADVLDAVDEVLRRYRDRSKPFGGVQLLLIGDLMQLAPVAKADEWELLKHHYSSPYFFASLALAQTPYLTIELKHIYRQSDTTFVDLLNSVRTGRADAATLAALNQRCIPGFKPADSDGYIRLTTHNNRAQAINEMQMALLPTQPRVYTARVAGEFPDSAYPAEPSLMLKEGAQVMFLRNDPETGVVNGSMGHVTALSANAVTVRLTDDGREVETRPVTWQNTKYELNEKSGQIENRVLGTFSQIPLAPAWAITIHKSQGLTFDRAIIDASSAFAHGQTYVALSRCRTLEGLVLERPLTVHAIISDTAVDAYTADHPAAIPDTTTLGAMQRQYFVSCLDDLFGLALLGRAFDGLRRVVDEFLSNRYPALASQFRAADAKLHGELADVSTRFAAQYRALCAAATDPQADAALQQRLRAGAAYFADQLMPFSQLRDLVPQSIDNKTVEKRLADRSAEYTQIIRLKLSALQATAQQGFSVAEYLRVKALALACANDKKAAAAKTAKPKVQSVDTALSHHPALYGELVDWRRAKAAATGRPAYTIASTKALIAISNALPTTRRALLALPGIGSTKEAMYGAELIAMVDRYRRTQQG